MAFNYADGIPTGKIVPMYLSDDGDLYTIQFHSMEEIDLIGEVIAGILGKTVAIDIKNPINDPKDPKQKITIYEKKSKKK